MGKPSLTRIQQQNEFLGSVIEKIGRQQYSSRGYQNPLARFKKGFINNANEIEEIYVARVQGVGQDLEGTDTLKRVKPDVTTQYHKQNFADCYTISLSDQQVRRAFTSEGGVKRVADEQVLQLQTGYEYDEFVECKKNIVDLIEKTPAKRTIADFTSQANCKAFIKAVKNDIELMGFRNTQFATVERSCKPSDLVLFLRAGIKAELDLELLASAFNKSVVELEAMIVVVDDFPDHDKVKAMLVETDALMIFDTLYNLEQQRNAKGMFTNHHLNVEKIFSTSNMYNVAVYSIA